jgi:O-antigen/teichoic acid export membrane protein
MPPSSPLRNFLSLALAHGAGYALGLVLIPFLLHVYDPVQYGRLVMAQTLAGLCLLLADYGSSFSAVQRIAELRDRPEDCAPVSSLVLTFRLGAAFALLPLFLAVCGLAHLSLTLALSAYLMVFAGLGFPNWIFQGRERMQWPSRIQIAGQILGLVLILGCIRPGTPIRDVALIQASVPLLQTFWAWYLLRTEGWGLAYRFPGWAALRALLRENFPLVAGSASAMVFCSGSVFWAGIWAGPAVAGLFGTAWKFFQVGATLFGHAQTALYPKLARLRTEAPDRVPHFFRRVVWILLGCAFALTAGTALLGPWLLPWVVGKHYLASLPALRILALAFPLVAWNSLSTARLVQQGDRWGFARILGLSALWSLGSMVLALHYQCAATTPAWVYCSTELLEALLILGFLRPFSFLRNTYA